MDWTKIIPLLLLIGLFTIPSAVSAEEFSITEVTIEAQLNENGTADITERHTYEFDGEFNGITRTIIPKQETSVINFSATENGQPLRVEQNGDVYRIHRPSDDETVTVNLQYQIENAVDVYEDGGQFYWPFFDERNESDYERMTITVLPSAPADDVLFLGYDEAYGTGELMPGGAVQFRMGEVPAGENGDIRTVFEPELFPGVTQQAGTVRDDVQGDREQLEAAAALFVQRQDTIRRIGNFTIPMLGLLLAGLFLSGYVSRRRRKRAAVESLSSQLMPPQEMSLPATICFTKFNILPPEAAGAALLELVRKNWVQQVAEDRFALVDRQMDHEHEAFLIRLLFDQIGDGTYFSLADLTAYTRNEKNHSAYSHAISEWQRLVAEEVKKQNLYKPAGGSRWFAAALGLALTILSIFFVTYGLLILFTVSLILLAAALGFAFFYKPLKTEGHRIRMEWNRLTDALKQPDSVQWKNAAPDDKMRAYAYGVGIDRQTPGKKSAGTASWPQLADIYPYYYNPILLTTAFVAANSATSVSASGTSAATGGGVGGGGGGSGAF